MKRKYLRLIFLSIIVSAAVILSLYSQPPTQYLFKIDKTPNLTAVLLQHQEIMIIQELETCYLGITDEKGLSRLDVIGISPGILDRVTTPLERYFLVHLRDFNQLNRLKPYGSAWPVEGNNVLFRPFAARHPREILPDIYRGIKKLGTPVKIQPKPLYSDYQYPPAVVGRVDPLVSQMTAAVSKPNLENYVRTLQNFKTRDAITNGCKQAGTFLYDTLSQMGIQVEYDNFNFEGYSSRNIVGYWPGAIDSSSVVILCAHYDSYAESGSMQNAPGADDNASGCAAVLETAAIMSGYSFRYSLKFILFSAEEWGFYGSAHYAGEAAQRGEKIIGVINLDMISYTDYLPEDLDVITNKNSDWLGAVLESAAQNYSSIDVTTTRDGSYYYSDQASFWDEGYPAVLGIEDYEDTNPYYHSRYDTIDTINLDFLTQAGKTCLAAAAQLAQPQNVPAPGITVTSPNGGESWKVGTSHPITWTSTGTVGNVKISYTTNNGSTWTTVTSSTANDGSFTWTVPNTVSSQCKIKISEASDGNPSDTGDAVFSIVSGVKPNILLNRTDLDFCALTSGNQTGTQEVWISSSGSGTLNWQSSVTPTFAVSWLSAAPAAGTNDGIITVSVDTTGLGIGAYSGTVFVTSADAGNSPQTIAVTLTIKPDHQDLPPFGDFSTPLDGSIVNSSIPVTGWVLDDLGMESVKIYREAGNTLVYIGDAVFVEGARPDIETAYPGYPFNYKAGWGYMMLTNFLPNQGNGTLTFYAIARDLTGNEVTLGTKTVTCNNSAAVKPFGAIDTPTQGGRASGSSFANVGWVLTPQPNKIPTDGSTLRVYVDGVVVGTPVYNIYREDIAALFPGYANSNGAAGYFYLDTTAYQSGVHTILWTAADNAGNADGIGSRYFTIQNLNGTSEIQNYKLQNTNYKQITNHKLQTTNKAASFGQVLKTPAAIDVETQDIASLQALATGHWPLATDHQSLLLQRGYNSENEIETLSPGENGQYIIEIIELERVVIYLEDRENGSDWSECKKQTEPPNGFIDKDSGEPCVHPIVSNSHLTLNTQHLTLKNAPSHHYDGYLVNGDDLNPLPIGSTLDYSRGVFYWQPGPGFVGNYRLVFIEIDQQGNMTAKNVIIKIRPMTRF